MLAAALALLLGLGREPVAAAEGPPGVVTVTILASGLTPASVTVTPGSTVSWANESDVTLNVTADDGSFDSGPLPSGETFQFVFGAARTVTYHVTGGPGALAGTVLVEAVPSAPATTPAVGTSPFGTTTAERPTDLASTGAGDAYSTAIGAVGVALGILLVAWARRRTISLAWLGSAFARHDDLLPRASLLPARRPRTRQQRPPRRSRHRI